MYGDKQRIQIDRLRIRNVRNARRHWSDSMAIPPLAQSSEPSSQAMIDAVKKPNLIFAKIIKQKYLHIIIVII